MGRRRTQARASGAAGVTSRGMIERLPFDIREAIIQVCGRAFWYKDPLRAFLASVGVPQQLIERFAAEAKFPMARHILAELDELGEDGWATERRLLTELCKLRRIPDEGVEDRDSALQALRHLKELAIDQRLMAEEERSAAQQRLADARRKQAGIAARAQKMEELRFAYAEMVTGKQTPQERGYSLEELLAQLFDVHEIAYRRPYKLTAEQVDGHFHYDGFDYLVEARWRAAPPTHTDLAGFKAKVDRKLDSTRGLFVSIANFRPEVVMEFTRASSANIVLMDGQDLSLILEGQVSLTDALQCKIAKAAQEGLIYVPLAQRF
jgi:hypothetical protein